MPVLVLVFAAAPTHTLSVNRFHSLTRLVASQSSSLPVCSPGSGSAGPKCRERGKRYSILEREEDLVQEFERWRVCVGWEQSEL